MNAIEINRFFLESADWVDPIDTVDQGMVGDPDKEIGSVLVTWIASFRLVGSA